jgi:hypothetical protein
MYLKTKLMYPMSETEFVGERKYIKHIDIFIVISLVYLQMSSGK